MAKVPSEFQSSLALQYVQSKGWEWRQTDTERIELETCPFCSKSGYGHFYMVVDSSNRDGLYMCHKCGVTGNLSTLKEENGDKIRGVESQSEKGRKLETMPDIEESHQALLEDEAAMDYLINGRGFSREIIEKQRIGFVSKRYFREAGDVRAIVYPYLVNGNCVFVHYRTLPTMPLADNKVPKAFSSLTGWDAPFYNGEILREGLKEVFFVEGEANCIAAMDHGVNEICGVPGANFKKALWIDTLDQLTTLEKIYVCYDKDRVGQKAAQALASRIGIERCYKIVLPDFTVTTDEGELRKGKDLNEWFVFGGGNAEAFEALKSEAKLFDVDGTQNALDALDLLEEMLDGKESLAPRYLTPWPSVNKYVGFEESDCIDIIAKEKIGKTTIGINLIEHMVDTYGEDGIIICGEMPTVRVARKWAAHVSNTPDELPKTQEEAVQLLAAMKNAVQFARAKQSSRKGQLYFCYPMIRDIDDLYKLIRDVIRRYGVKWIMVDNLQLFCDKTLKSANRTIHLSQISKTLKGFTTDFGVQMIRIVQPHQIKVGAMVTTDNTDGASQVMKDCDAAFTAHRERDGQISSEVFQQAGQVECGSSFKPELLFGIGLTRYSSGGYVTLYYDGARSSVRELNAPVIVEQPKTIKDQLKDVLEQTKVSMAVENDIPI